MSPVSLGLDGLLTLLLLAALLMGARLNGKLKSLRESQAGFVKAVADLDLAAGRAEAGLSALRAATQEAHDALLTRIETARTLSARLDRASEDAASAAARLEASTQRAERAAVRAAVPPAPAPAPERATPSGRDDASVLLRLIETAREEAGHGATPASPRASGSPPERFGALRAADSAPAAMALPPVLEPLEPQPAAASGADRLARFVARRREARAG